MFYLFKIYISFWNGCLHDSEGFLDGFQNALKVCSACLRVGFWCFSSGFDAAEAE